MNNDEDNLINDLTDYDVSQYFFSTERNQEDIDKEYERYRQIRLRNRWKRFRDFFRIFPVNYR
jgi:hypothetical protein